MKIDLVRGRLGAHRFHPMLIHFPVALYPFSVVMYWLSRDEPALSTAGLYAHAAAVAVSVVAIVYGLMDLIKIDSRSAAWRTGIVHAGLNACWFFTFIILLAYRIKHPDAGGGTAFLIIMAVATLGVFVSNYFGAEMIVRHRVGVSESSEG